MLNYKHTNTNPNTIVYTVYYKLIVSYVQTLRTRKDTKMFA